MKKITSILLVIFGLLLAGCQANDQQSEATAVPESTAITEAAAPTEAPATEPAAEPTDTAAAEAAVPSMQPRYEPLPPQAECFLKPPENLGIEFDLDCGYIVVPEFYDRETDRPVKLGFTRLNSSSETAASPLFMLLGGPGQSFNDPTYFLNFRPEILGQILETRDIVLLDQRGTQNTDTFLDCPEYYQLGWEVSQQGLDRQAAIDLEMGTLQKCIDQFKAQGVDLNAYNSVNIAADVNAARQAMGYDRIIYYGASYGSQLGQHVMRDFPEMLEAVVLDGAGALSRKSWVEDRALDAQWGIDNLIALCEADEKCNETYDIPAMLEEASALFADGPITGTYTDPDDPSISVDVEVDESTLFSIFNGQQGSGVGTFSLPAFIWQFAEGGASAVEETVIPLLGSNIVASRDATQGEEAILMHLAVVCSEDYVNSVDDVTVEGVGDFARVVGQNKGLLYALACPLLDVQQLPDTTDVNVTTDVPTLLLTGDLDVATPYYHSQQVADSLPNSTLVVFPGRTHVQMNGANQCAGQIMTQFVLDPTATLDKSCLAEPLPYSFILPDDSSSSDVEPEAAAEGDGNESATGGELPADIVSQLDTYLQSQVYTEGGIPTGAAPGLVLYVKTPDGTYLNAAGVSSLEDGTPMQGSDILEIGSNTKSMTIVLLMQLVEQGLISLDDPLSKYLPEQAAALPNGDQITIRQMAQHTAGLWDYGDEIIGGGASDPVALEAAYTPEELVQYAADKGTPYFAPGQEGQWKYSNTGYVLLGMIIEQITGQTIGDLMQTRIFDPLGMESATFLEGVPQPGEITTQGYWWNPDGQRVNTTNWNASQGWAAGAAAMTAADLATYGQALAAGELFQNPETVNEMLTFYPAAKFSVGGPYGLGLIDFAGDGTVWGHGGQTLGFQSLWYVDPAQDVVVVGLTNSATYKADAFLNVRNILQGDGALPLGPITLTPIGSLVPTTWRLTQFASPAEMTDIDPAAAPTVAIGKDGSATVNTGDCGSAIGNYTVGGGGQIDFVIDASSLTCDAESLAAQFVQHLNDAARWSYANGRLLIELPMDGGTLVFEEAALE